MISSSLLAPLQVGVGVPGGLEASVHAARRYLQNSTSEHALVKLDFKNAFNSIRRDCILESTLQLLPEIYTYVHSAYSTASDLYLGEDKIRSDEGVQQGDPLGPLLFCITIQPLLTNCPSELRLGYLDDITLGDKLSSLGDSINKLKADAERLGLTLNETKCEVISSALNNMLPSCLSQFILVPPCSASLLGSPLSNSTAMQLAIEKRTNDLKTAAARLNLLKAHDALVILKHSRSIPTLLHNLRSSYCGSHPSLQGFDDVLRQSLSEVLNVHLDDLQWLQASLPVREGGLGIRRACQLAPSAFLASASGTATLISSMLPASWATGADPAVSEALCNWTSQGGLTPPIGDEAGKQRSWDQQLISVSRAELINRAADDYSLARLTAVAAPHAGDWLHAPPLSAVGLRMDDETVRVAVGLRLGATLCTPHQCPCGGQVDARGSHGLSCHRSAGRQPRHAQLNDIIQRALGRAGVSAVKEPSGLIPGSLMRPDGATIIPWTSGKCLAWDATVPDTCAASHIASTKHTAGAAAALAAAHKTQKYAALAHSYTFVPIAVETFGAWAEESLKFIKDLGRRVTSVTKEVRETTFLFQRLSVAIQRGNAISFRGSLPVRQPDQDDDYT